MHFFLFDNAGYWIRDKDSPEQTPEDEAALGEEEEDSAPVGPVAMAATAAEFPEKEEEEEDVPEVKDEEEEEEVSLMAQSIFSKLNVPPHIGHNFFLSLLHRPRK